jgi:Predicted membrane protein
MTDTETFEHGDGIDEGSFRWLPAFASVVALVGLLDSAYLTVKHFTHEPVPCSLIEGCEQVLTSPYAEMSGVPLAALGAAAYFVAFSLAILAAFGNRMMWTLFCIQAVLMAAFSVWLLYLQGAVIGAFCQFCLISAATSFTLAIIVVYSKLTSRH